MLGWTPGRRRRVHEAGEAARLEHSAWLTVALGIGGDADRYPRIPVRRVADGGFAAVVARPEGRRWTQRWWGRAFDLVD